MAEISIWMKFTKSSVTTFQKGIGKWKNKHHLLATGWEASKWSPSSSPMSLGMDRLSMSWRWCSTTCSVIEERKKSRLGRERNLYQEGGCRSSVKIRRGVGVGKWRLLLFALPPPPTPTVHSNSKSNRAGRINDREFTTLARTNRTRALQARDVRGCCFQMVYTFDIASD